MDECVAYGSAPLEHKRGRLFEFSHIMKQAKAAFGWNGSVSYVSVYHSVDPRYSQIRWSLHSLASWGLGAWSRIISNSFRWCHWKINSAEHEMRSWDKYLKGHREKSDISSEEKVENMGRVMHICVPGQKGWAFVTWKTLPSMRCPNSTEDPFGRTKN